MTSTARHYSLAHPPPTQGELDGRETVNEAEILEMQALQAEHDGDGSRSIPLMERALQIRCHVVNQLREKWANAPETVAAVPNAPHRRSTASVGLMNKDDVLREYQAQCSDLYDAAERLVVSCNACGVDHFKKDAFAEATPLLEYAMQLTDEDAYPLSEVEERRRHLRGVTLNNLGCMERRRGHFSEALNYMKASMEMTGVESPVAYMNMSAILIQLRLNDEAVRMAERSIALLSQMPEDPSLLAVAHHNLAMALEPVDSQRCVAEYEQAYHIACTTLGKDSATSQSIQHSWQRFERTRAPTPPPGGRFLASRSGTTNLHQCTASTQRDDGLRAATTPPSEDAAEIFPHPFLLTASAPREPHAHGLPPKAATLPSRPAAPIRRAPHAVVQEKTHHRPSPPPPAAHVSPLPPRPSPTSTRPAARSGAGLVPSPPTHIKAAAPSAASRRFSPSRATEYSPNRSAVPQRRLSEQSSTHSGTTKKAKCGNRLSPLKMTITTGPSVPTRSTAATSIEASGGKARPSRVPRRPAERNSKDTALTPSPPPRVLPPLQAANGDGEAAALKSSPRPSCSTAARASPSQDLAPAAASMDDNPLAFLQNRLDVLLQDEEELEQKYAQATVIQRHYRGHLARKRVAELRALRARDARLAELRRERAARQIQHAYRNHRNQRRYPFGTGQSSRYAGGRRAAQHNAATQLQRIARGWLARRRYAKLRQFARDSPAAAAKIQRWYRGVHAQWRHAALLAEKARREAEAQEQEQQQYAATRIQSQWRAYAKRNAYKTALRNRMMARAAEEAQMRVKSAIRIQSAWRGAQARKLYHNVLSRSSRLRGARQEYEQRCQAAVKLQSFGRMIIARNRSLPLLTAARLRAASEINTRTFEGRAARTIQCAYRSHAARRLLAEKKSARDLLRLRGQVQAQVMVLQRVGRGYDARKSIGAELSALQGEAERYERRLRALEDGDAVAAREASEKTQRMLASLQLAESEHRGSLLTTEQKERHMVQHHCDIAAQNMVAEERERKAARAAVAPTLDGFGRIIKAKRELAQRQGARDAYLDENAAVAEAAHEDASARVIAAFLRSTGARRAVRSRADAINEYNDARELQEAASSPSLSPSATAAGSDAVVMSAGEAGSESTRTPRWRRLLMRTRARA
ncbi:Tetratricopeptide repeat/IQ calmodulin-binding motif containing protein [Lotmaria passim]